ncbi:MAG: hypothetical protein ACP5LF_05215 [Nitrososphaeria archaeon]|nr:hypothetical protein [Conexivisphaerales archaeon]
MSKGVDALIKLESSLAGLYATLFRLSYFGINAKTVFQKIAMDSMEHEELLRLLEKKLDEYETVMDDEVIGLCESLSEEVIKLSKEAGRMSVEKIYEKLRELEKGEELAYEIYEKYLKEAGNKNDQILVLIMQGIAEDEQLHDRLLSTIISNTRF